MKTGAYFFSMVKKNQVPEKKEIKQYILVSDDHELKESIADNTQKNVGIHPVNKLKTIHAIPGTEIIFDANGLTFNEIISTMERLKNSGATFKIAHKDRGFFIGSNSSNDRGEVRTFTVRR
jgi:hypothetical protein